LRIGISGDPAYQGFTLLRAGFTALPIVIGADKFANVLVNWERYLAPWIAHLSPLSKLHIMHVVGVIEIVAGIAVAIKPRYAAYLVAGCSPASSSICPATQATATSRCAISG